jgi:hypothetical protein
MHGALGKVISGWSCMGVLCGIIGYTKLEMLFNSFALFLFLSLAPYVSI